MEEPSMNNLKEPQQGENLTDAHNCSVLIQKSADF